MLQIVEPITTGRMLNKNTDKYVNVTVPIDPETLSFAQNGGGEIAGVDGTAAELKVNFLNPVGSKDEVKQNKEACALLEKIRGAAACIMGFAKDLEDATENSPAVPKVCFLTAPVSYTDIEGKSVKAGSMDICARVISVFKCHKACPLTLASAISVASKLEGSIIQKTLGKNYKETVKIGHPVELWQWFLLSLSMVMICLRQKFRVSLFSLKNLYEKLH